MEWVTTNLDVLPKMNPTAQSCRLQEVGPMLFLSLQGWIELNNSWNQMFVRYYKEMLWQKGYLGRFVSRNTWDLTRNWHWISSRVVRIALVFPMFSRSKHRFRCIQVDQTYQPWHKRCRLPRCVSYLVTSNLSLNNEVNTKYHAQCSEHMNVSPRPPRTYWESIQRSPRTHYQATADESVLEVESICALRVLPSLRSGKKVAAEKWCAMHFPSTKEKVI